MFLNYKRILDCSGLISGLQINYEKLAIISLNCHEDWVHWMSSDLNCSVLSLPVKYLGIPLGANPKTVETWQLIINKIRKKLSSWKVNMLSKAGK